MHRSIRSDAAVAIVLALSLVGASATSVLSRGGSVAVRVAGLDAASPARPVDVRSALAADGTFRGSPGLEGSVDTARWRLVSDVVGGERPRFEQVTPSAPVTSGVWSPIGANSAGTNGALSYAVLTIAISGNNLYVGGMFDDADGDPRRDQIARWDGSSWSSLGGGTDGALNEAVYAIAVMGGVVYAGGGFTNAGGKAKADYLAKWDGSAWTAVGANGTGPALNDWVRSLAVSGTDLYVGGSFQDAGGVIEADSLARWNGTWSAVGAAGNNEPAIRDGAVTALLVSGSDLYVGGNFTEAGYVAGADFVARWDGAVWHALGASGPGTSTLWEAVHSIAVDGSNVYVGGWFYDWAGIPNADYVARWDGTNWHALGSNAAGTDGALTQPVWSVAVANGVLYVGGSFTNAAGIAAADFVASWNGASWSALSSYAGDGAIRDLDAASSVQAIVGDGPSVIVGGYFFDAFGNPRADYIARFTPGATYRPDGRIRKGSGSLVGNNVYNATGVNQTRTGGAAVGAKVKFGISLQNDGSTTDRFTVQASGATASGYTVQYFRGTNNITAAVVGGTYQTPNISPGGTLLITAKVAIGSAAATGSSVTRLVTATSVGNPALSDTVKFVAKRK